MAILPKDRGIFPDHATVSETPDFCSDCVAIVGAIRDGRTNPLTIVEFFDTIDVPTLMSHVDYLERQGILTIHRNGAAGEFTFEIINDIFVVQTDTADVEISPVLRLERAHRRLTELDAIKPTIRQYYEDLEKTLKEIVELDAMIGGRATDDGAIMFQPEAGGDVFEISRATQQIVMYKAFEYKRTARDGEPSQGHVSRKRAEENGFVLPKKAKGEK